jgi:hypothetical protein
VGARRVGTPYHYAAHGAPLPLIIFKSKKKRRRRRKEKKKTEENKRKISPYRCRSWIRP